MTHSPDESSEVATPSAAGESTLSDGLGAQTARGLKWTTSGTVVTAVMQLVYTVTMSRLLVPEQFGVFAIGSLSVQFTQYFAQMGITQAVIQRPDLDSKDIRAAWTSSVLLGLLFTGVFAWSTPLIADLFDEPLAAEVLRPMGLTFTLAGLGNTATALLRRRMQFRLLTIASVTAFFVGFLLIGIPLAVAGAGVWSLVWGNLGSFAVGGLIKYHLVRHEVRPLLPLDRLRSLYAYGARASLGQFTEFAGNNLDTFAVGRGATSALLGQYNRAYYLVNLPLGYLMTSLSQVLFSTFSRIQDDADRVRATWVRSMSTAGVLLVPLAAGLGVAAEDVVEVTLGPSWDEAATVVPILAIAASGRVLTRLASVVFEARARLNLRLSIQFGHLAVLALAMWIAAGGPLWHYAAALAVAEGLRHVAYLVAMRAVTGVRFADVGRAYGPALVATLLVVGAVLGARSLGSWFAIGLYPTFLIEGIAGLLGLLVALRLGALRSVNRELRQLVIGGRRGARGRKARMVEFVLGPEAAP